MQSDVEEESDNEKVETGRKTNNNYDSDQPKNRRTHTKHSPRTQPQQHQSQNSEDDDDSNSNNQDNSDNDSSEFNRDENDDEENHDEDEENHDDNYDGNDEDEDEDDDREENDNDGNESESPDEEDGEIDEEEEDDGNSSSEEEDSDNDEEDDQSSPRKVVTEDGREISEYEMLRLERIRRNKQKLAQLGLESQTGGGVLGEKQQKQRRRKREPSAEESGPKRSSLSRRSKGKVIHYATSLPPVRMLLQGETQVQNQKTSKPEKEKKPKKTPDERMDQVLHYEFRRIKSQKTQALRQAEKDNRAAAKEVKYWKNHIEAEKRKEMREQKRQELQAHRKEEQRVTLFGGKTARQILKEVDERMPELLQAAEDYDEKYEAEARHRERELQRFEMDERMKTMDALERFPKTLKESISLLNAVFVERAPKDPAPPRRSKRTSDEADEEGATVHTDEPKKKKAKVKKEEETAWSQASAPAVDLSAPVEEENKSPPTAGKKRKRGVRNVGGWVSPDWAQQIRRSWLERDHPPTKFDLRTFVPQVGDTLLYFPKGHYDFLREYPDILGKKTRQSSRVPLWERMAASKGDENGEENTQSWCLEDWAQAIADQKEGGGTYPILVTVQIACAEFPPDPNTKLVLEKETSDGGKIKRISFKGPKEKVKAQSLEVRLALTLRPLSPVLPGLKLPLPPTFSVVTFPSKLKPFLVPFAWAYLVYHSMAPGATVVERRDPENYKRITHMDVPDSIPSNGRINPFEAAALLKTLGDSQTRRANLSKILIDESSTLRLPDAFVALSVIEKCAKGESFPDSLASNSSFLDLVSSTLPVWDAATVTSKDVYDRKKRTVQKLSPWELVVVHKNQPVREPTPDRIAQFPSEGDESLRLKIVAVIDVVISDHPSGPLFLDAITEDVAPSYFCAVPVGMWLSRIKRRLRGTPKLRSCYYRSVGAVLSDVSGVLENCLLYNSPDSDIAEGAVEVVSNLKDGISRVVRDHNKEISAVQKADEERRLKVMQLCGSSSVASGRAPVTVCQVRKPYRQELYRDWLQSIRPLDKQSSLLWIPQAGEEILYSREKHALFVKGHHNALELAQCEVLSTEEESCDSTRANGKHSDWLLGKVLWTRAVFPRHLTKRDIEYPAFQTNSTLLAVGTVFSHEEGNEEITVIYWRPCIFPFEKKEDCNGLCEKCGMSGASFLRPAKSGVTQVSSLTSDQSSAIERCLSFFKKRLLREESPSDIDPSLTKTSIKQGFELASSRAGLHSLPSFENVLEMVSSKSGHGTRKGGVRFEQPPESLAFSGYIPHWMLIPAKETGPKLQEMISPWPKLCLELIRLRLQNGYYRTRNALENDLVEAFSSLCFMMVAEPATQKKNPLSLRKLAKGLISSKGKVSTEDLPKNANDSEDFFIQQWVEKIQPVRDLYGAAIAVVSVTEQFERLSGLHVKVPPVFGLQPSVSQKAQSQIQLDARENLRSLLNAIRRDPLSERMKKKDSAEFLTKISVICGGEKTQYEDFLIYGRRATATINEKEISLKIVCGGEEVRVDRLVPRRNSIDMVKHESTLRLKIIANGEEIEFPDCTNISPGTKVRTETKDCIEIGAEDLERSDTLVRFLYGRPGRKSACGRCTAHKRNMYSCRVRRAHVNKDFDWDDFMDKAGGVDAILNAMTSGDKSPAVNDADDRHATLVRVSSQKKVVQAASPLCGVVAGDIQHTDSISVAVAPVSDTTNYEKDDACGHCPTCLSAENDGGLNQESREYDEQVEKGSSPVDDCAGDTQLPRKVYPTWNRARNDTFISEDKTESRSEFDGNDNNRGSPSETEPVNDENRLKAEGINTHCHTEKLEQAPHSTSQKLDEMDNENSVPVDAKQALEKAESALELSEIVLAEARRFAKAPPRLSKAFVEECIPIDKDDGHLIYCIICGLSGNLICCDGCPNVLHGACIGLGEVPEDEWFCEECTTKKAFASVFKRGSKDSSRNESNQSLPFGRFDFDQDRADRLTTLVQELRDLRPDVQYRRHKKAKKKHDEDVSDSEVSGDDAEDSVALDPSNPIHALPDKAISFLRSIRILSLDAFLCAKTAFLADKFAKWRKKEGLVELRGSGHTAYISSWKRLCRDVAVEKGMEVLEDGGVVWKEDSEVESDVSEGSPGRRRKETQNLSLKRRRRTTKIEEPWDALSSHSKDFLASIGIRNAEAFLEMRTTDIAQKYAKWRKKNKLAKLKSSGEIATVSCWKTAVRKAEEALGPRKRKSGKKRAHQNALISHNTPKKIVTSTPKKMETHTPERTDTSLGRSERAKKRQNLSPPRESSAKRPRKKDPVSSVSRSSKPTFDDPLEALPTLAQEFLRHEGIESAEEFLALRSGEIGDQLGAWRQKKGLNKLKGSGEGATISAWKTICRKAVTILKRYHNKQEKGESETDDPHAECSSVDDSPKKKGADSTRVLEVS